MKNQFVKSLLLLMILFCTVAYNPPDGEVIRSIAFRLEKWSADYPQEKVYLHLARSYYAAGDSIWFKAYVTVGAQHQLSALSGVLQVELVNQQNRLKQSISLPVSDGITWGEFALPSNMPAGIYRLRAYTNWMRNFSDDYFYDETIIIGNPKKLQATASYSYNGQQISAVLSFMGINQVPQANRPVSYEVLINSDNITKGAGTTDATGKLNLTFTIQSKNDAPYERSGQIISKLITADNDTLVSQVVFNPIAAQADVQFFPEGGSLVTGISSVVGFKAVGPDGLGIEANGRILDNDNNTIVDFRTQHRGMGSFKLNPEHGKSYRALIDFPDGSHHTFGLPQAKSTGYVMSITQAGNYHRLRITASANMVTIQNGTVNLIAQQGGKLYYAGTTTITANAFSVSLPDSRFPSGIVQFTLFSDTGQPVAERLVFIKNDADLLKLNISSDKATYAPYENAKIDLHVQSSTGEPVLGSFSASIIKEGNLTQNNLIENTILSNLLLTSDLKGFVEQPAYYFTAGNEKTATDLDVLMLTQGYRRFEWKALLSGNLPAIVHQPEKGISISGKLTAGGKAVSGGKVTLFSGEGSLIMLDTISNKNGRFSFQNLQFADSTKFTLQARTAKGGKDVQITLDTPLLAEATGPKVSNAAFLGGLSEPAYVEYLEIRQEQNRHRAKAGSDGNAIQLKAVTIEARKPAKLNSTNLNGTGRANQIIMGDEVFKSKGCRTILECLEGRLTGVLIKGNPSNPEGLKAYSMRHPNGGEMGVMIDGAIGNINNVNPEDVQSIEVLNSGAYTAVYGGDAANGIILINLKHGNNYRKQASYANYKAPGVVTVSPKGLYVAREFYKPAYKVPVTVGKTDQRSIVDWENNLVTDKQGNISFNYFNSSSKGTYCVVVEGIDTDGHLGRQIYRYRVE